METLLEAFNNWANANRDVAYFVGFLVISLIVYFLQPFKIGLSQSVWNRTPFRDMDVGTQVKKPHRPVLLTSGVAAFAILHFLFGMPGVALVVGSLVIGALVILDIIQIERDNPPQP